MPGCISTDFKPQIRTWINNQPRSPPEGHADENSKRASAHTETPNQATNQRQSRPPRASGTGVKYRGTICLSARQIIFHPFCIQWRAWHTNMARWDVVCLIIMTRQSRGPVMREGGKRKDEGKKGREGRRQERKKEEGREGGKEGRRAHFRLNLRRITKSVWGPYKRMSKKS